MVGLRAMSQGGGGGLGGGASEGRARRRWGRDGGSNDGGVGAVAEAVVKEAAVGGVESEVGRWALEGGGFDELVSKLDT